MDICKHDFYQTEEVKFDKTLKQQLVKFICKNCGEIKWESVDKLFYNDKYNKNFSIIDGY
jgi:hypothetical protein